MEEEIIKAVEKLSLHSKHKLVSIWMSKERIENTHTLELLLELDEIHSDKYQENRNMGFSASVLIANEYILKLIYG